MFVVVFLLRSCTSRLVGTPIVYLFVYKYTCSVFTQLVCICVCVYRWEEKVEEEDDDVSREAKRKVLLPLLMMMRLRRRRWYNYSPPPPYVLNAPSQVPPAMTTVPPLLLNKIKTRSERNEQETPPPTPPPLPPLSDQSRSFVDALPCGRQNTSLGLPLPPINSRRFAHIFILGRRSLSVPFFLISCKMAPDVISVRHSVICSKDSPRLAAIR